MCKPLRIRSYAQNAHIPAPVPNTTCLKNWIQCSSCLFLPLRWCHNGRDSVSNHQPHDCLLNRLFRRRSKKTSKLRVTGLLRGIHRRPVNSPHKWPVTRKMFPLDDVIMPFLWIVKHSTFVWLPREWYNEKVQIWLWVLRKLETSRIMPHDYMISSKSVSYHAASETQSSNCEIQQYMVCTLILIWWL